MVTNIIIIIRTFHQDLTYQVLSVLFRHFHAMPFQQMQNLIVVLLNDSLEYKHRLHHQSEQTFLEVLFFYNKYEQKKVDRYSFRLGYTTR